MGINDIFTNILNSIYGIYENTLSYLNLVMSKTYGVTVIGTLVIALIIPIILLVFKKKRIINNMTAMLIKNIKIVLMIIFISKLFNVLNKDVTNVINVLFNTYRPLIYLVVVFLFLIELVFFNKSAYLIIKTYLRNFLYVNYIILFISTPYSIEQLVLSCLLIVLSIEIISCLELFKLKNSKEQTLYKSREKQIEDLNNSLRIHKDDNYAIAINGPWGSGKTEFLKYYMDKYPDDYYIYIQPMVTDTIDSLIKQFKDQLIKIMIDSGIYKSSINNIERYFSEIGNIIQFNNKLNLMNFIPQGSKKENYIDLKSQIQEDINILNNSKDKDKRKSIVIIVDDFDRIDKDKQKNILHFIKEIVDFKGCSTIFAFDFEKLKDNELDKEYLEKFVSTTKVLSKVKYKEILDMQKYILKVEDSENRSSTFKTYCSKAEDVIENNKDRLEELKEKLGSELNLNRKSEKSHKDYFPKYEKFVDVRIQKMDNSRRVIHFLKAMRDSIDILDRKITEKRYDDEILSKGKVIESIYALNYLKVFDSDIFDEILRRNSIEEYIINLQSDFLRLTVPAENEDSVEYIASLVKKEYINDVFKDIRAKNRFNEEQLKCEKINMMIINDIFIDNKSDVIKLTPNMDIDDIITSMDKIPDDNSQIKSLIRLQNIIISKDDDKIKQAKELQEFINKAIDLYESKEIEWATLFELMNKRHVRITENMEMYLDSIINYINNNNNIEIKEMDKNKMLVELRDAENDVVHKYKSTFINLILICKIDNLQLNFDELNKEFSSIMDSDRLLKLLISKFELQGRGVDNFNKLYNEIEELLKKSNYGDIATDNLLSEVKNFIRLNDKIKLLKTHKITTKTQDRYEYLLSLWNLSEFKDLKKLIYDINGEQSISEDMIGCFSKALDYITYNYLNEDNQEAIDDDFKDSCRNLMNKIKMEQCYNEIQYINMKINVQKILNLNN